MFLVWAPISLAFRVKEESQATPIIVARPVHPCQVCLSRRTNVSRFRHLCVFQVVRTLLTSGRRLTKFLGRVVRVRAIDAHRHRQFLTRSVLSNVRNICYSVHVFMRQDNSRSDLCVSVVRGLPMVIVYLNFQVRDQDLFRIKEVVVARNGRVNVQGHLRIVRIMLSTQAYAGGSSPRFLLYSLRLVINAAKLRPKGHKGRRATSAGRSRLLGRIPPTWVS